MLGFSHRKIMHMDKLRLGLPESLDFEKASWADIEEWFVSMEGVMTPDQIAELREDIIKLKEKAAKAAGQE